jgi:hypothetical protein
MMRNFAALAGGLNRLKPIAMPSVASESASRENLDLSSLGYPWNTVHGAALLLREPLEAGGTLRTLPGMLKKRSCDSAIGKTGTSESDPVNADKAIRDKIVITAFRCGDRRFVEFGLIGSPDLKISLGEVTAGDVVNLMGIALTAVTTTGARYAQK